MILHDLCMFLPNTGPFQTERSILFFFGFSKGISLGSPGGREAGGCKKVPGVLVVKCGWCWRQDAAGSGNLILES